jgi:hypothetical protein
VRSSALKASGTAWAGNDAIGVFMVNHGSNDVRNEATNKRYVTATGDGNFAPAAADTVYYPVNGDKVNFIAYYPYVPSIATLGAYAVNVSDQSAPAAIDLLYAKATGTGGYDQTNTSPVALSFGHKLSKLTLNIAAPAPSTQIIAADLASMTVSIAGLNTQASFDLAAGTLGAGSNKAAITPLAVTAGAKYEAILLPGDFSGVSVSFGITQGSAPGNYVWNVPNGAFEAGKEYVYSVSFTGDPGEVSVTGTIAPWDVVYAATPLLSPADGASLLVYSGPTQVTWTPVDANLAYTVKIATTAEGLTSTPLSMDAGITDHLDLSESDIVNLVTLAGITDDGQPHTLYWTVVPTGVSATSYQIRSVIVQYPATSDFSDIADWGVTFSSFAGGYDLDEHGLASGSSWTWEPGNVLYPLDHWATNAVGWHTASGGAMPHWLAVDMKSFKKLTGFYYWNATFGSAFPKAFTIDVSNDGTTWNSVLEYTEFPATGDLQTLTFGGSSVWARYYRINITEVHGGHDHTFVARLKPIEP